MSVAVHLLRRRSILLLQHRYELHSSLSSSAVGIRKFTTSGKSKPPGGPATEGSSSLSSKALAFTTAGAAILVLSTAAWYTTGNNKLSWVRSVSLPQVGTRNSTQEEVPSQTNENKAGEEELVKESLTETFEASSGRHEQIDVSQPLQDVRSNTVPHKVTESEEKPSGAFLLPILDGEQVPPVGEHDSGAHEVEKGTLHSKKAEQDQHDWKKSEILGDVNGKNAIVKSYLVDQANDAVSEIHEVRHEGNGPMEVRNKDKPGQRSQEISYIKRDTGEDEAFEEELNEMMEIGSGAYTGAHRPSRSLSASHLVQKGHEATVKNYLHKEKEREVSHVVDTEQNGKDKHLKKTRIGDGEKSKGVGFDVLVGAVHTAEKLQAEVDGHTFQQQLHKMEVAQRHELKDLQARILTYAKDTDNLEREIKKEKEEAAAKLELQNQRAEERLQAELKHQEKLTTKEKETLQLLEQLQAAASITQARADHLKDIDAIQLRVDALHKAFYTRSEEARMSHTAHKLAMGAFALENAIVRGDPVEKEANLLIASAGGPGVDPLVDAIISSLPSEVLKSGARTPAQLRQKFTGSKDTLRELVLLPSGGGGAFTHFLARLTANLKISERGSDNVGNEGIEVVIGKVERFLAEKKLVEAAELLEARAQGTAAESLAGEWAKEARNRVIIEQGLEVLRAHVVAVASGLS